MGVLNDEDAIRVVQIGVFGVMELISPGKSLSLLLLGPPRSVVGLDDEP